MVMKQKRSQHSDVIEKYRTKMEELDKEEQIQSEKIVIDKVSQKISLF